ncbi:MAG: LysR family transcriptional regulator [Candidatus Ventricola sp.]
MDIKQIQYFLEVSRMGSFTSAAKKLYISAPGLVKSIEKLEEELGVRLFVRTRSGVCLTPSGNELLRYAPAYLRQHEFILSQVRRVQEVRDTRVEVLMTWGLMGFFPSDFLSSFVRMNPDIQLTTRSYTLEECREALLTYRGEVALYFGKLQEPSFEMLFHREAPLYALMSRDHPLAAHKTLSLSDFARHKLVLLNNDSGVTQSLIGELQEAGCSPQIILDGMEWTQALEMISSDGYVSFCLFPRDLNRENLVVRPLRDLKLTVKFSMVKLRNVTLSAAEQRFVDYVIARMNKSKQKETAE